MADHLIPPSQAEKQRPDRREYMRRYNKAYYAKHLDKERERLRVRILSMNPEERGAYLAKQRAYARLRRERRQSDASFDKAERASGRAYSAKHRANRSPQQIAHQKNMDKLASRENREKKNSQSRIRRAANPEKYRMQAKQWRDRNKELVRVLRANCRAIRLAASGRHTAADVISILRLQRGKCAGCRQKLPARYHVDHIKALARGGTNDRRNLQILCQDCNHRKHAKDAIVFMRELGRLL